MFVHLKKTVLVETLCILKISTLRHLQQVQTKMYVYTGTPITAAFSLCLPIYLFSASHVVNTFWLKRYWQWKTYGRLRGCTVVLLKHAHLHCSLYSVLSTYYQLRIHFCLLCVHPLYRQLTAGNKSTVHDMSTSI